MIGPLISQPGSGNTNLGLAIGENATGFWKTSTYLAIVVGAQLAAQTNGVEWQFVSRVNLSLQPIINLGDPTEGTGALNLRTADARYLSVDQRLAPSMRVDLPADIHITGGTWGTVHNLPFPIPRGGVSRVRVDLSVNIALAVEGALLLMQARINGEPERRIFGYGFTTNLVSGFTTTMFADVSGSAPIIHVECGSLDTGSPPPDIIVLGGDASVVLRSQVLITDLGPAT